MTRNISNLGGNGAEGDEVVDAGRAAAALLPPRLFHLPAHTPHRTSHWGLWTPCAEGVPAWAFANLVRSL